MRGFFGSLCFFFLTAGSEAYAATDRPLVAVIDSGVALTDELKPLMTAEFDMGSNRARPTFQPTYDHGTMVATILAREAEHDLSIVSIRIDDDAGCPAGATPPCQQDAGKVAQAIWHAVYLGVDAINISLTLSDHPQIVEAVRAAGRQGIPVILAAGNDGLDHPLNLVSAKAAFPAAILVGALDGGGHPWKGTNRPTDKPGKYVYRWQLGVNVPTVMASGAAATATGTSFAAPIETARIVKARNGAIAVRAALPGAS
ncbi:S8/S53 family peptidase [Allosphingosinicella vermicomposti]|uniref:S8/S53 family peptidase n=1 Tax=Allosphingosinicella vermicomposti TaxID=614671 RepID=UPI000D10E9F0|nr:S8/S53 family peptidase [Allosphingosinicella vermicomposti]